MLNNRLYYSGVVSTQLCDFCGSEKETIMHFFCECPVAKEVLSQITDYLSKMLGKLVKITDKELITGLTPKDESELYCRVFICTVYNKKCMQQNV